MLGLTIHRANTAEATPREAAQKILDGMSELAAWTVFEVREVASGRMLIRRLKGAMQTLVAYADAAQLKSKGPANADREVPRASEQVVDAPPVARRQEPVAHPDQTTVHLGPQPSDQPVAKKMNGVHPRPAPIPSVGLKHPRSGSRHR